MKKFLLLVLFTASFFNTTIYSQDTFEIDYTMAKKSIDWLNFIDSGADTSAIHSYFMDNVAPTEGCKTIIAHWARFRKWDNEIFYDFIAKALDIRKTDEKVYDEDGNLTRFGERKRLWQNALTNTAQLRDDIETLKKMNLTNKCIKIVRPFLPPEAELKNNFYVVLFGASTAFSVGDRNGFDLLQMARTKDDKISAENVELTFAHELHHTGFSSANNLNMGEIKNKDKIMLVGIITGEGMATYFINKPFKKLEQLENLEQNIYKDVSKEWKEHLKNTSQYYIDAEKDIKRNLEGNLSTDEIVNNWLSGAVGKAYALGVNMFSVIDKYLGREAAVNVARDYRTMLVTYNKAAQKGLETGEKLHLFDEELVQKILNVN